MKSKQVQRRKFLQTAAAAAAAGTASCGRRSSPWRFFTADEAAAVRAATDRIVPPDDSPGAAAAGVVNYIDLQLVGPFKKYQRAYREGLPALDGAGRTEFGKSFAELTAAQQDSLLHAMEARREPFFELLRDHTMQGFYGDPRHGGNREYASWVMLDIQPVPIRGRQLYDISGAGASRTRRPRWRSQG